MCCITPAIKLSNQQRTVALGGGYVTDEYELCAQRDVRKRIHGEMLRVDDGQRGRPGNRPSRLVILEGSPGSGKSAVLDGITRDLVRTVPFARFHFTAVSTPPGRPRTTFWQEIDDALAAIVWDLAQWRPIYGSLRFPRFAIAQLVRQLTLEPNRPIEDLRREVITALEAHRGVDKLRPVLKDGAAQALGQVPGPLSWTLRTLGPYAVQLLFDRVVSRTTGRRVLLGRYQSWFGTRGQGNDIDVLINLNRWTRNDAGPTFRAQATQLMFAAFFADLRDDFQRGRRAGEWSFNGVLFLENVACAWGAAFLTELAKARAEHRRTESDNADPLTVVATSRTRIPVTGLPVRRILLRPLDSGAVDTMVGARAWAGGDASRLAARIHAFTGGHPEAVDVLLEAAVGFGTADVELGDLLAWRRDAPDGATTDQADALLDRLLPTALDDEVDDLVTLSAARDRDQVVRLARRTKLLSSDLRDLLALGPDLWVADNAGGQLLRRLLLRRLAQRDADHPADWIKVHGALRRFCRDLSPWDAVAELYHALAVGDLRFVVAELGDRLRTVPTAEWLDLLKSITAAPSTLDERPPERRAAELAGSLTAADETTASLAGVVAGVWIATDPATRGNQYRLHKFIAKRYEGMADAAQNPAVIEDEAEFHHKVAEQWR